MRNDFNVNELFEILARSCFEFLKTLQVSLNDTLMTLKVIRRVFKVS